MLEYGLAIVFFILIFTLTLLIILEYRELRKFNTHYSQLVSALSETVEVVNRNADSARQETLLIREMGVEIAIIKQVIDLHGKALSYTLPNKQWEEIITAFKKASATED